MQRSIMKDLLEWKNDREHKPAMIKGVRQCGKTWVMKELGKTYRDCAYFSFEKSSALSQIFDGDLDVDRIVNMLGIMRSEPIGRDCLIILDEIQLCSRAITSLKYFCEDGRYDVICAGSLLGVKLTDTSPPVGKVKDFRMYPLSFDEFLRAKDEGMLAEAVKRDPFDPAIGIFRPRLMDLYREFLAIGGLPEVVDSWIRNRDPNEVEDISRSLIDRYIDDIMRYGDRNVRTNGEAVWRSVPAQLARDNSKFVFGHVRQGARARDLWSSVDWLEKAELVYTVPITVGTEPPSFEEDVSSFKLYCFDTGIMRVLADLPLPTALQETAGYDLYRGAIAENYVVSELKKMTRHRIHCWRSGNRAEVDFLTKFDTDTIPIEVKAGEKVRAQGLKVYLDRYGGTGVIASLRPISRSEMVLNIPLYEFWMLPTVLKRM